MASLFSACKSAVRNKAGGTYNIGGYDIDLEYYSQSDIDADVAYGDITFGDSDESKILLVADSTITIPSGYTLTPDSPKKSLVIFCNNLINNGTISMYQKAPNVLPHNYFIIEGKYFGSERDVTIPAYADNGIPRTNLQNNDSSKNIARTGINGNNGTSRQCGSGGTGCAGLIGNNWQAKYIGATGSGYAFGGGAGSGGMYWGEISTSTPSSSPDVDSTYPMRGGNASINNYSGAISGGGVGNPVGTSYESNGSVTSKYTQNFGCGGRIIIFCVSFINNGIITVNGTDSKSFNFGKIYESFGGASGAGAVDMFYTSLTKEGTITAVGGNNFVVNHDTYNHSPGKGGNGSITLTPWTMDKLFKGEIKYFSNANVNYLLTELAERIRDSHMGE